MCGITGIAGNREVAPLLVESIARLEYRGYDSCGLATLNSAGIEIRKDMGPVGEVADRQGLSRARGRLGIAHTRWATHGGISRENAHPHPSCDGAFAVVHNGIIANYRFLKADLCRRGHTFISETDTEVVAHLLEELYRPGLSVEEAFVQSLRLLEGTFAVAVLSRYDPERIYCAREKSPLILGIDSGTSFLGSDVNAFLPYTRRAIILDDGEYAMLSCDGYAVRAIADGSLRHKPMVEVGWTVAAAERAGYAHYMEKEICEQPDAVRRALEIPHKEIAALAELFCGSERSLLVGVGTTHYMALFGQYLLAALAGEFAPAISSDEAGALAITDSRTVLLAISQSGETFDTLQALRQAKRSGARTAAIVNVPGSSMTREVELVIHQDSGPEICVISTKAAMAQLALLIRLAVEIGSRKGKLTAENELKILRDLAYLPKWIEMVLQSRRETIQRLAHGFRDKRNWFFLGRGLHTPMAFECALKMKEVTYLHAEGMAAGFLKHGTLSLIDEESPSVVLIPPKEEKGFFDLTMSSVEEVRARRGKVLGLAFDSLHGEFDGEVLLPKASAMIAPLLHLVAGQLLAYEMAVVLGRNVDRPRSLAKSVTVS